MDWMKKHVDTLIILCALLCSGIWMNGRFSNLEKHIAEFQPKFLDTEPVVQEKESISNRELKKIIKTVLIVQKFLDNPLSVREEK